MTTSSLRIAALAGFTSLLFTAGSFAESSLPPLRRAMSLNGEWSSYVQPGSKLELPEAKGVAWKAITVPGMESADRAWFRKSITIPETMKGQRVEIYFHGVGIHSKLYVNRKYVGEHFYIVAPWAVDITDFVEFGKDNEILVGVESGNASASAGGKTPWTLPQVWFTQGTTCGIYYDVELRSHPAVFVDDVFVQPSFRQKTLKVSFSVVNRSKENIRLNAAGEVVSSDNKTALSVGTIPVEVGPGESKAFTAEKEWKDPHLWFPHDPYLYSLHLKLVSGGKVVDDLPTRFGFRECWVEKTYLMFNGVRAPVRRTTEGLCWIRHDRQSIHNYMYERKSWGLNNVRWHCLPAPGYLLDIADEMGMMITQEGDMWMDQGNYTLDDAFWKKFAEGWGMIAKYCRNHPCILSYSIANESFNADKGVWTNPQSAAYKGFHLANQTVRRTDPGTFIEYASGDEVCGDSPVRNWHYPSNLSARWNVPNDFYWLAHNPHPGSTETPGHRTKPVIIGEDFYDGFRGTIGSYAAFGGEDYYLTGPNYRQGETFFNVKKFKTDAYRLSGIAVVNPADPCVKPWEKNVIPPVTMLAKGFAQDFVGSAKVSIAFGLANEVWFPQTLEVRWTLTPVGEVKAVLSGSEKHAMAAGTIKDVAIEFPAPTVDQRKDYVLKVSTLAEGKSVNEVERRVNVFPPASIKTPEGLKIGLYDPARTAAVKLKKAGLEFRVLPEVKRSNLRGLNALIIGPNVSRWKEVNADDLGRFVLDGGNVLVLEQSTCPPAVLGDSLNLDATPVTVAFTKRPDHAILKNVQKTDLRWWGKDHWVADAVFGKPRGGNFRVLAENSDSMGLRWTPLVEFIHGRGRIVYCQLLVGRKFVESPLAKTLLQNMVDYLAAKPVESIRVGLLADSKSNLAQALAKMRASVAPVDKPDGYATIIADAGTLAKSPERAASAKKFIQSGGTLVVKSLTPEDATFFSDLVGRKVVITAADPYQGARCADDPFVSGISHFDLWWRVGDWVEGGDGTRPVSPLCRAVLGSIPDAKVLVVAMPKWEAYTPELEKNLKSSSVALAEIAVGKGKVVVDQVLWESPEAGQVSFQYAAALLMNLGVRFGADQANVAGPSARFLPLSLKGLTNQSLKAEMGTKTPTGEGLNNLARLPMGPEVPILGIPFDISGIITLKSPNHAPDFPERVNGLACGKKVNKLQFLHGCGWGAGKGITVVSYVVHYADRTTVKVDAKDEVHLANWWMSPIPLSGARLAWDGKNEVHMPICVYLMEWKNPKPRVAVSSIDFVSGNGDAIPFVVGVTAELAE